jgi:integrase
MKSAKRLKAELVKSYEKKLFQHRIGFPWWVKLQRDGVRKNFSTRKVNKAEAAEVAVEIATYLNENGMQATIEKYGEQKPVVVPPEQTAPPPVTVGRLISETGAVWLGRPRTFSDYTMALRRVIGDLSQIERHHHFGQGSGRKAWLAKVDAVPLDTITRQAVEQWRVDYIKRAGADPVRRESAETSSNTLLRACKAVFNTELLEKTTLTNVVNPFERVKFTRPNDHRFQKGGVDAAKLLSKAVAELADTDLEAFKAITLATCCGLRRNEIDKIEYSMFNLDQGTLSIDNSAYLHVKSERSKGVVELEPALIPVVRAWQAKATGSFVLESLVKPRLDSRFQHYRCMETFSRAVAWLRAAGVKSNEPLHFCRKLYGSLICDAHGIFAASRSLRHADISTTSRHYVSRTENVLPGLGSVLTSSDKVIPITQATRKKSVTA